VSPQHRRSGPREEEVLVARALEIVFPEASVEQHDDGSEDGMYDLRLTGPFEGAVEVGQITDSNVRQADAHWRKALDPHETSELERVWTFKFTDIPGRDGADRFPRVRRPDTRILTEALKRLEARGIYAIGTAWDHREVLPGGWRIGDPDIAALFSLLGAVAEHARAVDLRHHGVPGGWHFAFGRGGVSHSDPDRFALGIEALLRGEPLSDMRGKLSRSNRPVRVSALVFDSTTGDGWSTAHLEGGVVPAVPITLPPEITHALVVGMNGLVLMYSEDDGWSRHSLPAIS